MLEIKNLEVTIKDKTIINGFNLTVKTGEVHAIMGPNGSGKSTLAKVITNHPDYQVTSGTILYEINKKKTDLASLETHERACEGIFLGFQYPVEIPGVSNATFLRESFNAICRHQGAVEMDPLDFDDFIQEKMKLLQIDPSFLYRSVNEGFSGGEKKKNEILQLSILNPRLAFLDETDSGLDIDALKLVANGVNKFRSQQNSIILITHYQRLLDYIKPDFVHIMYQGKIIKSGDQSLALELEKNGYERILKL